MEDNNLHALQLCLFMGMAAFDLVVKVKGRIAGLESPRQTLANLATMHHL